MASLNNLTGGFTQPNKSATIKTYTEDFPQLWKYQRTPGIMNRTITPSNPNANVLINKDLTILGDINLYGQINYLSEINSTQEPQYGLTSESQEPKNNAKINNHSLVYQIQQMQRDIELLKEQLNK